MEEAQGEAFHRSCLHLSIQKRHKPSLRYQKGKPKPKSELSEEETPSDGTLIFLLWASVGSQRRAGLAKDMEQSLPLGVMPCKKGPGHQVLRQEGLDGGTLGTTPGWGGHRDI